VEAFSHSDGSSQTAYSANVRELLGALGGKPVKDFPDANATELHSDSTTRC